MVTAILPSMTDDSEDADADAGPRSKNPLGANPRHSTAYSVESELTITPERYTRTVSSESLPRLDQEVEPESEKPSALAGFVGTFTGAGAVVALVLFLPLPARFGEISNVTPGQAVSYSFYVVAAIAFLVALFVFFGLRNLRGEDGKGWATLLGIRRGDEFVAPQVGESSGTRNQVRSFHRLQNFYVSDTLT